MLFEKPKHDLDYLRGGWIFVGDTPFGDSGKGMATNFICYFLKQILGLPVEACVRPNGGDNAGHEVFAPWGPDGPQESYRGHVVPMGILQGVPALVGPGAVFNPGRLLEIELKNLADQGIDIDKVFVSLKTHIILPHYELLEELQEKLRGKDAIGTTKKAIGPTYEYRAKRAGIQVKDVIGNRKWLREKIEYNCKFINSIHTGYGLSVRPNDVYDYLAQYRDALEAMAVDEQEWYRRIREKGGIGVAELGQGDNLDNIQGEAPYITSSLTTIPGGVAQAGLSHKDIRYATLVSKGPYLTRVGGGSFFTEMSDEEADKFRKKGKEYGTTTGRPRRCGWQNMQSLKKALELSGADCICYTKMDITADQEKLKVWTARGHYEEWDGWKEKDIAGARELNEMPWQARQFIEFSEIDLGNLHSSIINLISTGPALQDMVVLDSFLKKPKQP